MAFGIKPDQFYIASQQAKRSKDEGQEVPAAFGYTMGSPQEFAGPQRYAGDKREEIAKMVDKTRNFGAIVDGAGPENGKVFSQEIMRWAQNLDKGPFTLYEPVETTGAKA